MLPVISRPKRDLYVVIGFVAFCGLLIAGAGFYAWHDSPRRAPQDLWIGLTAIVILFFLPCAFCWWLMRRLRLVADQRGLQIRRAFRTQFIEWRDIEDYELRASPNHAATSRLSWIRANGKWQRLPILHDDLDALRARVRAEATNSRARQWQLNVAREDTDDWPKTYAYRDAAGAKGFALIVAGLLLVCALIMSGNLGASQTTASFTGDLYLRWLQLATLLSPLLLIHFAIMRAKKRAGAQTVRADQNGLIIVDNEVFTRIAWKEISDYFIEDPKKGVALPQYIVESAGGRVAFAPTSPTSANFKL